MFITFEGIDASGKTTQITLLEKSLKDRGFEVLVTRQPGGSRIGQLIRAILLNPEHSEMVPETEMLLYMADRIQHIKQVIEPALSVGKIVLCDRYHDATVAYQGFGRQLDISWLEPLQKKLIRVPDLTLWFDISVQESRNRLNQRNLSQQEEDCRLEREDFEFFNRIRNGYQKIMEAEPERFKRLEAENSIEQITSQVEAMITPKLSTGS